MPENIQLDAFLTGAPEPQVDPAPAALAEAATAAPEPKADAGGGGAKEPPVAATEADDEGDLPEAREGEPVVPRSAFLAARNDWKSKAVKAETEAAELRRQLEEAKRAPAPAATQPAAPESKAEATPVWRLPEIPLPNPVDDPDGFAKTLAYNQRRQFEVDRFNARLDMSEERAREKLGDAEVDKLIADFRTWPQSAKDEIYAARDAYGALAKRAAALRVQQEMGDDPAAWREAERAKLRAEIEAEMQGQAPAQPQQRRATPAPSLANVRSAAPRSASAFTGPPGLDDIVAGIHRNGSRPH